MLLKEFQKRMFNKTGGVRPLALLFEKKEAAWAKKLERLEVPLTSGWVEGDTAPIKDGLESEKYAGSKYGPTAKVSKPPAAMAQFPLVWFFLLFIPITFLDLVAKWTNFYATEQDVYKAGVRWVPVSVGHPQWSNRTKRYKRKRMWVKMTSWYLIAWIDVLVRNGARRKRSIYESWTEMYGLRDPVIADVMNRDAFAQAQQFVVFQDYSAPPTSAANKADKYWKVRKLLNQVALSSQQLWTLGVNITIDESMIRCKSRFVTWKQYMPLKPIKHGIKVFVLACGESGYVYNFDVYQGRQSSGSTSVMELVLGTLITGNLQGSGRILYTDNYYTSIALAVTLLAMYGIYIVGTYSPKKNARHAEDSFPFAKLTASDAKVVNRGWMRRATNVVTRGLNRAKVQSIVWKDSKMCGFISTAFVGLCDKSEVFRSIKGSYKSLKVKAHDCIIAYLRHYGAVDRADRGMGDYTVTVRASRWYMRVVFWALDVVLWNMWVIAAFYLLNGTTMHQ